MALTDEMEIKLRLIEAVLPQFQEVEIEDHDDLLNKVDNVMEIVLAFYNYIT